MNEIAYFTICSKNYLAYALTLGRSLMRAEPEAQFFIFLADAPLSDEEAALVEFETIEANQLPLRSFGDMVNRYSVIEFNTAIKPACFQFLFSEARFDAAVYLDPDIYVLKPLVHVAASLLDGDELVLTPHSTQPLDDGGDPDDRRLLQTGVYNLGFAAFRKTPKTEAFLSWWSARLERDCLIALEDGLFVDQKWMDLAPAYISSVKILDHPGYNTAYWNLMSRPVTYEKGTWRAAGELLHFFHFSGVTPGDGRVFSKHQDRYSADDIGDLKALLHIYLNELDTHGYSDWRRIPYAFAPAGAWSGADQLVRRVYRRVYASRPGPETLDEAAIDALCNTRSSNVRTGGEEITNLAYEIWSSRSDLRTAFDLATDDGRQSFNHWMSRSAPLEYALPASAYKHLHFRRATGGGSAGTLGSRLNRVLSAPAVRAVTARLPAGLREAMRSAIISLPRGRLQRSAEPAFTARPDETELEANVRHYGYHCAESGIGAATRSEHKALCGTGMPVEAVAIPAVGAENRLEPDYPLVNSPSRSDIHLIHVNADQTCSAEQWSDPWVFAPDRHRIGYWAWELDVFPDAWSSAFDRVDEIWTPSTFVTDVLSRYRPDKPVYTFPHCISWRQSINPDQQAEMRTRFALPENTIFFLNIFDFNSFADRKNPLGVLDAFGRASQRSKVPLGLVLKCHGGEHHEPVRRAILQKARLQKNVFIVNQVLRTDDLDRLYRACDVLISLHRSEGFGLTIAEAMAYGLPVIATGYSGPMDFLDDSCGVTVPYTLVSVPSGAYPESDGARWAEPDIAKAADAMVELAHDPDLRARLGAAGRDRVFRRLSQEGVGRSMAARLDQVFQKRSNRS